MAWHFSRMTKKEQEELHKLVLDCFGVDDSPLSIKLDSPEECEETAKDVAQRLTPYSDAGLYLHFLEQLFRQLCLNLKVDNAIQLAKTVNFTAQEIQKNNETEKMKQKPVFYCDGTNVNSVGTKNDYDGTKMDCDGTKMDYDGTNMDYDGTRSPEMFSPTPAQNFTPEKQNSILGDFRSSCCIKPAVDDDLNGNIKDSIQMSEPPLVTSEDDVSVASPFLKSRKVCSISEDVLIASPFFDKTNTLGNNPQKHAAKKVKKKKLTQQKMDSFVSGSKPVEFLPKHVNTKPKILADDSFFDNYEKADGLGDKLDANVKPSKKRQDRQKMHGFDCACCRDYYNGLDLTDEEKALRIESVSRHRGHVAPPSTPPHFWEFRFPSTPECISRGYMKESENAREKREQMEKQKLNNFN